MFTEKNTTYQYPRAILSVDLSGESMCNHVMLKQVLRLLNGELSWKHTSVRAYLSTLLKKLSQKLIGKSQPLQVELLCKISIK